ncbi:hypothetical protein KP509_1Z199400 [Ceratopteris richardii]|nr:hypothetical protein KP509_1Z199400 [Ceratopteris richardii]
MVAICGSGPHKRHLSIRGIWMTVNVRTLPLLDDMEAYRDEAKASEKKLKELKQRYETLAKHIHKMQVKVCQEMAPCPVESRIMQSVHNDKRGRNLRWGASTEIHPRSVIASCIS